MDLYGPGERSLCGDEALPRRVQGGAVSLYRSRPGATIKAVAADLGVSTETLRNWIRAADGRRSGAHSAPPAAPRSGDDTVQAELAAARRRRNATSSARQAGISQGRRAGEPLPVR
ncbi:transposase [Streptomyces bottropensis]|uniref:transposase n=1 Tax=Streptomyces bottropensis TaxID=42235 RepID=UPI0037BC309B